MRNFPSIKPGSANTPDLPGVRSGRNCRKWDGAGGTISGLNHLIGCVRGSSRIHLLQLVTVASLRHVTILGMNIACFGMESSTAPRKRPQSKQVTDCESSRVTGPTGPIFRMRSHCFVNSTAPDKDPSSKDPTQDINHRFQPTPKIQHKCHSIITIKKYMSTSQESAKLPQALRITSPSPSLTEQCETVRNHDPRLTQLLPPPSPTWKRSTCQAKGIHKGILRTERQIIQQSICQRCEFRHRHEMQPFCTRLPTPSGLPPTWTPDSHQQLETKIQTKGEYE